MVFSSVAFCRPNACDSYDMSAVIINVNIVTYKVESITMTTLSPVPY